VIDTQRNVIDHRQRSKTLGEVTQINRRQSSLQFLFCRDQRPAFAGV
jgi:hypothetical protein